jgi:cysteine-rich repeat protein
MKQLFLLTAMLPGCILLTGVLRPDCGDNVVEPGEECDDGNEQSGDGCDSECLTELNACGDGQLNETEICDDGNTLSGDGCRADCQGLELCGDGLLDPAEACDDANVNNGDGCDSNCQQEDVCGDGIQQPNERCDDGNNIDGDGCEANCTKTCEAISLSLGAAGFIEDPNTGHCYLLSPISDTWPNAVSDCSAASNNPNFPSHLVTITSAEENALLRTLEPLDSLWIGLTDLTDNTINSQEGRWRWITGERLSPFVNFAVTQPDNGGGAGQNCAAFFAGVDVWDDAFCNNTKPFICEIDFGRQCGNRIVEQGEECDDGNNVDADGCSADCTTFKCDDEGGAVRRTENLTDGCFILFNNPLPTLEAQLDCLSRGGFLATVTTSNENLTLDLIGDQLGAEFFFGLSDFAQEGTFLWANGETFGFDDFQNGQPDDFGDGEDCVEYQITDNWNDIACDDPRTYVCEF